MQFEIMGNVRNNNLSIQLKQIQKLSKTVKWMQALFHFKPNIIWLNLGNVLIVQFCGSHYDDIMIIFSIWS